MINILASEKKMFLLQTLLGKLSEITEPTINNMHHAQSFDSYAIYRNHNPRFRFVFLTTCLLFTFIGWFGSFLISYNNVLVQS